MCLDHASRFRLTAARGRERDIPYRSVVVTHHLPAPSARCSAPVVAKHFLPLICATIIYYKYTLFDSLNITAQSGREASGVPTEVEAQPRGAPPGRAQEAEPARAAGEVRAAALEKAGGGGVGKGCGKGYDDVMFQLTLGLLHNWFRSAKALLEREEHIYLRVSGRSSR